MRAGDGSIWFLDFKAGQAREITLEEHARMAMEQQKRLIFKDGVCYLDCEPPEDADGTAKEKP